jgi:hypothetical protein
LWQIFPTWCLGGGGGGWEISANLRKNAKNKHFAKKKEIMNLKEKGYFA